MENFDSLQQRLPRFRLRASAIMGVIEQAVIGVCGLGVYALVVRRLGVEDLSVWSLVQMASLIAEYFSYPTGNTLIHHIARSESQGERERSVAMVETAVVMKASIFGAVCLCGCDMGGRLVHPVVANRTHQCGRSARPKDAEWRPRNSHRPLRAPKNQEREPQPPLDEPSALPRRSRRCSRSGLESQLEKMPQLPGRCVYAGHQLLL